MIEKKDKWIHLVVNKDLWKAIEKKATELKLSKSEVMRRILIEDLLEANER